MESRFFADIKPGSRVEVKEVDERLEFSNLAGETWHIELPEGLEGSGGTALFLKDLMKLLNSALALSGHILVLVEVWKCDELLLDGDGTELTLQEVYEIWDDQERAGEHGFYCDRFIFEFR